MCAVKNRFWGDFEMILGNHSKIKSTQEGGKERQQIKIYQKKNDFDLFFFFHQKRTMNRKGKEEERGGKLNCKQTMVCRFQCTVWWMAVGAYKE